MSLPAILSLLLLAAAALVLFLLYYSSRKRHMQCVRQCHSIASELGNSHKHGLIVEKVFHIIVKHTHADAGILLYRKSHADDDMEVLKVHGFPAGALKVGQSVVQDGFGHGLGKLHISNSAAVIHQNLRQAIKQGTGLEINARQNMLCIPIASNHETHGMLQLISSANKPYTKVDVDGFAVLGVYLDAVIQNSSKIDTIRRERNAAQSLYAIGLTISRFLQLDEILHHAVDEACRLLNADLCWHMELSDQEGQQGVVRHVAGPLREKIHTGTVFPLGGRIAAMVRLLKIEVKEYYILIKNLEAHEGEGPEDYVPSSDEEEFCIKEMHAFLRKLDVQSGIIVPIAAKNHVHGMLCSFSVDEEAFDNFHVTLQQRIANQVLIAINTADYHAKTSRLALIEERQRMSNDLHDNMAQVINGLSLELHSFIKLLDSGKDKETLKQRLESIRPLLEQAKASIREGIFELRIKDNTGIWENLATFASSFEQWHEFTVHVDLPDKEYFPDILHQHEILRVAQEALWNIHKHSNSREAWLCAEASAGRLRIEISDKGRGMKTEDIHTGQGIQTMRDRLSRLGGALKLLANKPQGLIVSITIPQPITTGASSAGKEYD